jgi:stage V sporulation protein R
MQAIFEAREVDRDVSFIRRFLTEGLMREMDMFQYEPRGDEMVIAKVSDQEGWREVKETLLKNVGMGTVPVIKIEDADHNHNRTLYMKHDHDGRDLQWEYAERTLAHMRRLWGCAVVLETIANGQKALLSYGETGFSSKPIN